MDRAEYVDVAVTTPKGEMETAAKEARWAIRHESANPQYFRVFKNRPVGLRPGSRVYYVEDGYIRGYAVVTSVTDTKTSPRCDATGRAWPPGWVVEMSASSWRWVKPRAYPGFQGHRKFPLPPPRKAQMGWTNEINQTDLVEVGGWKDPKPSV